jgi:hypothetical protein
MTHQTCKSGKATEAFARGGLRPRRVSKGET